MRTPSPDERSTVVAVIGGGCAGTLVAANLLRRCEMPLRVVMIERSGAFGPGVAYETDDPQHLLNVPAQGMSAFCDEPLHFVTWAQERLHGDAEASSYLPRGLYGGYLRDVLADSRAKAEPQRTLELLQGEAIGLRSTPRQLEIALADGRRVACDKAVLAIGPPQSTAISELPADPRVIADPWAQGALSSTKRSGLALVIGTGLTAVDASLSICDRGGRVLALSRRGWLPYDQLPDTRRPAPPPPLLQTSTTLAALERHLRSHVEAMQRLGYDWRDAIDGLRPVTPQLWCSLPTDEQRRFLRERMRAWEVRRHRMAPAVAKRVRELMRNERMGVLAGSVSKARANAESIEVEVQLTRSCSTRTFSCEQVVLCTGSGTDITQSAHPLLRGLLSDGVVRADRLGLGLRSAPDGALLDAHGHTDSRLFALGALRRGELWETTAVQEIRAQAEQVAQAIERSLALGQAASGYVEALAHSQRGDDETHPEVKTHPNDEIHPEDKIHANDRTHPNDRTNLDRSPTSEALA